MARFSGQAVIPTTFFFRYLLPSLLTHRYAWRMMSSQVRKYRMPLNPEKDVPVGMVSLRANEVCNLRCASCGQWGENGHLLRKLQRGERLNELSFDVVKRIVHETARDNPFYYNLGRGAHHVETARAGIRRDGRSRRLRADRNERA